MRAPTSYWNYIRVEEVLGLQKGLEGDESALTNDEVLFIVVHQVDELWFKIVLRELVAVRNLFAADHVPEQSLAVAVRGVRRMEIALRQASNQFELLETLTTRDYLGFRDKLSPASGFQSAGLREVEILAGLSEEERIPLGNEKSYMNALRDSDGSASPALRRVEQRLKDVPTLREAIEKWLWRTPIRGSNPNTPRDEETVSGFVSDYVDAMAKAMEETSLYAKTGNLSAEDQKRIDERFSKELERSRAYLFALDMPEDKRAYTMRVRASLVFIESYRELPLLAWPREVIDALVAFEQAFVLFRQRHARMVERIIGRRTGTGGSAGVDYLDETARRYRIFKEVWAVRTLLIPEHRLPPLAESSFYGFSQSTV